MKRKMFFRAWDGEKMHYDIVPWQWDFVISRAWHRCEKSTGSGILGSGGDYGEFLVPGIRFKEIMQFTGLKDKNSKEIYEGDIISHKFYSAPVVVTWNEEKAMFDSGDISMTGSKVEVIGNIYENPELLPQ